MKKSGKYKTAHLIEDQFEPGSDCRVLRNKLGIISPEEMEDAETIALEKAMDKLVRSIDPNHRFTAKDICDFHKLWLKDIYSWAGKYRQVNVTKDGFPFASALQIRPLMTEFERDVLFRNTPCNFDVHRDIVSALAETHVELVLIHPFREGNGRVARMLSTLMALQAGLPLLNFDVIAEKMKKDYLVAIQAGLEKHYRLMQKIFDVIIEKSDVEL